MRLCVSFIYVCSTQTKIMFCRHVPYHAYGMIDLVVAYSVLVINPTIPLKNDICRDICLRKMNSCPRSSFARRRRRRMKPTRDTGTLQTLRPQLVERGICFSTVRHDRMLSDCNCCATALAVSCRKNSCPKDSQNTCRMLQKGNTLAQLRELLSQQSDERCCPRRRSVTVR